MTPTRVRDRNRKNGRAKMAFLIDYVQPRQEWREENRSISLTCEGCGRCGIKEKHKKSEGRYQVTGFASQSKEMKD